ncbi:hypothetical protein TNCV_2880971 [Trichonephila clavipes]|nr:hypothetical protein TNCV_2880971 [Trichonephila clavipes]
MRPPKPSSAFSWRNSNCAVENNFIIMKQGYEFRNDVYVDGRSLFCGLLCKVVSTSATLVFTMDALPNRFLTAIDPVTQDRYTKSVIVDAFGNVSPGYFC